MRNDIETHGACILVVDDDAILASALKGFLTREKYCVEVAQSAAEALSITETNPGFRSPLWI